MRDISNIVFGAILSASIGIAVPFFNSQFGIGLWLSIFIIIISSALISVLYARILSTIEYRLIYKTIKGYWKIDVGGETERNHAMAYIGHRAGRLFYKGWGINSSGGFVGSHWDGDLNSFVNDCLSFNTSSTIYSKGGVVTSARNHGEIHFIGDGRYFQQASGHFVDLFGDRTFRAYSMKLTRISRADWEKELSKAQVLSHQRLIP